MARTALLSALASGALFGVVALLQAPLCWCALIALAPWIHGLRNTTTRVALASAALLSVAMTAAVYWPLPAAIAAYSGAPLVVTWLVTLLIAPILLQPQFLIAALFRKSSVGFVSAYLAAEWLLPRLFADTLGYGLHPSPLLRQAADLAGNGRLLTLACLLTSLWLVQKRWLAVLPALLLLAYGLLPRTENKEFVSVGIVQANITAYDKLAAERGSYETVKEILDTHESLSRSLGKVSLLVWPETVYPTTYGAPKSEEGAEFDRQIAAIARDLQTPLIFGAFEESDKGEHNAAFLLQPGGSYSTYRKSLLFPLTEWVPFEFLRQPWMGHWQPGPGARALTVSPSLKVIPLICYEALSASYVAKAAREGAQLLVAISNDAWFPGDHLPKLHLTLAAFRSLETGLPMIRATNSGNSALITPDGEIHDAIPFGERRAIRVNAPLVAPGKLIAGDWLGPAALLALAIDSIARRRRPAT